MRINKFVAQASGLSRRAADAAITQGQVTVNGQLAKLGQEVSDVDEIIFQGHKLSATSYKLVILNKPAGYVCSRNGQGSPTIYDLLPPELHSLKSVGRLDKDSSGLLLLTNDGQLTQELTHPKYQKEKVYEVELDKQLTPTDKAKIEQGVELEDGTSKLELSGSGKNWQVKMSEGRNRQIRRTFATLGYQVANLHRTEFGNYKLDNLRLGTARKI